ncbi:oncostatin-M isoform X2 [Ochotona princeps]|uniref:oncostatin-M isoform X2 n=1 Tax=Ochotona princeps TaxID=9978 RepID=UPI00271532B0|nr:oncostatin-M isoform X2 [Ochotona princeps]
MRAPLPWRSLFSVGLGLLLLITAVRCTCLPSYSQLLSQLRNQAKYLQSPENLLNPYVISRGLEDPPLKESCKERPGEFPSQEALSMLSRRGLLLTVSVTSDRVLSRLEDWKNRFSLPEQLQTVILYLRGLKNNLSCMIGLLKASEPTQASPRTLPPPPLPPHTLDSFQVRVDGCKFLCGYQRFMHSVHQVLNEWGDSRSRRQSSSHQGQGKQAHGFRIRPSVGRVRTARPRAQLRSRS